jgi:sorbitol-6-phosphate 2-dehydrogenase/meso-butanediol dehydrogenase/(S,S)-butanediol dehydrogenase/diacetyl reductase
MTALLLQGKTALVTGAARGIGLAVARAYASHGARVVLADLDPALIEDVAQSLPGARGVALNVAEEAATEALFDQLAQEGWAPDVVVPNAGILHLEPIDTYPADRFRAVLEVNLTGAFLTARAAARRLQRDGRIILTSSLFGLRSGAQNAGYAASKFGMVGLMQSMAADLAPRGILVNAVAPGQIQTEMMDKLVHDRLAMGMADPRERLLARIPLGRLGTAEEVANAYVWLASPLASYVTGQTIVVDGGWQVS